MIEFTVPGVPMTRGSKRAIVNKHTGKPSLIDSCKGSRDWMARVALAARKAHDGPPFQGPVWLALTFAMPRPKYHYRTGKRAGELKPDAPLWHAIKPDEDKLTRPIKDALKGIVYLDDCQVVSTFTRKIYGAIPGATIVVESRDVHEPRKGA